jgi:hypothetical protein
MGSHRDPTLLTRTYSLKMNSHVNAGQQSSIIFKRNY